MQLLKPDPFPPTFRDRAKAVGLCLCCLAVAAFLYWDAARMADPAWTPCGRRLKYMADWTPFWRSALCTLVASFIGAISLLGLWKAVRPYTPES